MAFSPLNRIALSCVQISRISVYFTIFANQTFIHKIRHQPLRHCNIVTVFLLYLYR